MKNKPLPIWIVTVYYGIASIWGLWLYFSTLMDIPGVPSEITREFQKYGPVEYILLIFQQIFTIVVCFYLFRLKKRALHLIAVLAVYLTLSTIWFSTQVRLTETLGTQTFVLLNLFGIGLWVGIWFYANYLRKKQVIV